MLFCDTCYVSTDAAYVKNSELILVFRTVVIFVIAELHIWNATLLKYTAN